ncbi:protein transporter Sec31 [Streptomyces sp. OM5714]|uniref:protein transporter Sec31 n=1 Tax=Streptomyces sp. OM5714 TaxID=2602736 RepID=UPI0013DD6A81|nr:protein transporter Sec31 [Streptomyces sp. OM5714]KAF2774649.1 protein transporter Sec31 [Streptomyces sp. OM5714]
MKTRQIERKRLVPHTVDGVTELVLDTEYIDVPEPPRDWDQLVRTAVTIGAVILVTASLVWTTASIGDLLASVTLPVVAYAAAVAFDASWIMCMGVEWLLRYDPKRAKAAQRAGWWALAVSMAAVFAHGHAAGEWVIGAVGALVSGLAKGGWAMAMRVHSRPLDPRTQQWVEARRAKVDGQLAMIPIRRDLQRGEHLVEAERKSLTADSGSDGSTDPDQSGGSADRPDRSARPVDRKGLTTKDAVRIAWDDGIRDRDAVLHDAANRLGRPVSPDSVDRYLRDLKRGA